MQPSPLSGSKTSSLPQKETLNPLAGNPQTPFLQPPVATNLLSVSMDLPDLDISDKWDHTIGDLLCLAFLGQHHVSEVLPCCSMSQYFLPFYVIFFFKAEEAAFIDELSPETKKTTCPFSVTHYPSRISQLLLGRGYKLPFGFPKPQSSDEVSSLCT